MRDALSAILAAHAAYVRCIDDGDLADWPNFFLEDAHYLVTSAENYSEGLPAGLIWAEGQAMLIDRISALREANIFERHRYRHLLGQPFIVGEADGLVDCVTPFLVIRITRDGSSSLFVSGRYVDSFRIDEAGALLASRTVVCDSSQIDTLLAIPL